MGLHTQIVAADQAAQDCLEIDELCVRQSPALWTGIMNHCFAPGGASQVGQVLGFMFGDRTDQMLKEAWSETLAASVGSDVPAQWQTRPVFTDHWEAYGRFFPAHQHTACDKGSGLTSRVEAWNTKWRQRQSGLVRRIGAQELWGWHGIIDDLYERFLILVDQHNRERAKRWKLLQNATQSSP